MLVLFCLRQNNVYKFLLENKTLDFITLISENKAFLNLMPVYLIFFRYKKPT